jgi:hypothetical protein
MTETSTDFFPTETEGLTEAQRPQTVELVIARFAFAYRFTGAEPPKQGLKGGQPGVWISPWHFTCPEQSKKLIGKLAMPLAHCLELLMALHRFNRKRSIRPGG